VRNREGTVAMRGGEVREVRIDSKAKVDVCLDCTFLGLKDNSLLTLMLKLTHVGSTINCDIFVEQP